MKRDFTTCWKIAATGLICAASSLPVAAQSLNCPLPHTMSGPDMLKETPTQMLETGRLLASGDSVNRLPEVVAGLRKKYPGAADAEIVNYLVTAYCPVVAKLDGLGVTEQQARVDRFARQADAAVYSH